MQKRVFNKLMLSSFPVSNFDFSYLRTEKMFADLLKESNIYMIVQRPLLYLNDLYIDRSAGESDLMRFQIRQRGNDHILECKFRFRQKGLDYGAAKKLALIFNVDFDHRELKQHSPPFNHVVNFVVYDPDSGYGSWFSPEKLLFDHWNEKLKIEIIGDIHPFLQYRVHYIGKATDEDVLKRLTGHERLQDVLSVEMPLHFGSLPTEEIALLFFEFSDNIHFAMMGHGEITEEIFEQMVSGTMATVPSKDLYLDAEKVLIHAFTPKHNKVIYKNYPNGKGNLSKYGLKAFTYSFLDPITLMFDDKKITGRSDMLDVDMLIIKPGEPIIIHSSKNK